MRTILVTGLALLVGAPAAVLLGSGLDLQLDTTLVLGVAVGAVVALVPDRGPGPRLAAFVGGLLAAWVTYLFRAGFTPDTATGRAVSVAVLVVLCVGIAAASVDHLPLWAVLLGAGTLAGGYETAYAAAPPEVVTTSLAAVTALVLSVAVGFLLGSFSGALRRPAGASDGGGHVRESRDPEPNAGLGVLGGAR